MDKLDVSGWKEFKVKDLFDVMGTHTTTKHVVEDASAGDFPYVTTSAENNGVFTCSSLYTENGDVITVDSAVTGQAFYQHDNFCASDHVEKLVPKNNLKLTQNQFLFLTGLLNANKDRYGYDYSMKRSQSKLRNESIKLPVTSTGEPDWQYMDSYIAKLTARAYQEVSLLKCGEEESEPLKILGWQEFKINQLFDIETGGDLVFRNLLEGKIPVVSHSMENNGIKGYYQQIPGRKRYDHEITLALADRGTFFASSQTEDFYVATRVKALIFKDRKHINENIRLFLCSVINRLALRFVDYSENATNRLPNSVIKLPVDFTGHPDWQYMNNYVKFMKSIADRHVDSFQSVIKR